MKFVDSHCHLSMPELSGQLDQVLGWMSQNEVTHALNICTTLEEFEAVLAPAKIHSNLWATVGVHPENEGIQEPTVEDLVFRASHPRVVAIGETGLDYFWGMENRTVEDMQWQRDRFRVHLQAAIETNLPVVIHTRSASADTLSILRDEWLNSGQRLRGVFHCFTETEEVARAALDLGFYVSFSGILTFKNAADLRLVAQNVVPLDRTLIETDSPYLAPVPHRGKTNTPAWVVHVAEQLAQLKGVSVEEVASATAKNFFDLFNKTLH